MNGLTLGSVLDYFFLNMGSSGFFSYCSLSENTHLRVRPFNFIENLFMVVESVMWQVVNSL